MTASTGDRQRPKIVLVTAPNLQQAEFWCRSQHLKSGQVRFILRLGDTQYIRGYAQPVDVHWVNEGPSDESLYIELCQLERMKLINIVQETT